MITRAPVFKFCNLPPILQKDLKKMWIDNEVHCQNGGYLRFPECWEIKECLTETNDPILHQFLNLGVSESDPFIIIHVNV